MREMLVERAGALRRVLHQRVSRIHLHHAGIGGKLIMSDDKVVKAETGMVRSKFERTLAKMEGSQDTVLVLDTSGSMQEHGATGERRIDALRSVVYGIRSRGTA